MTGGRIEAAVRQEQERRQGRRRDDFGRAKSLHEGISRRSGAHIYGLDEEGKVVPTRTLSSYKIAQDKWVVYMRFRHEDREALDAMPAKEIDARVKEGNVPRKAVQLKTHIIRALRLQKHIRKGYQAELAETDALLARMDTANHALAAIRSRHTEKDIGGAIEALSEVYSVLSRKQVVVKRLLTRERVERTMKMLEEAKSLEGNKRDFQVSRACAVFTSARNRLGAYRDKQVAGIAEHNLQKEAALRIERDRWIASQLKRFSEIPELVRGWCVFDRQKLAVLDQVEAILSERKPDWDAALSTIKGNHTLFRVGKRERADAEARIRDMEQGIMPDEHGRTDYLIGHYGWLYRHAAKKDKQAALEKIGFLRLFVNGNKPGFIYDELGKEPDPYLGPVLEPLGRASEAFDSGSFSEAGAQFALAWAAMSKIAYPER